MQNSTLRVYFGTCGSEINKMRKKYSKFKNSLRYLVLHKFPLFVPFLHTLPETPPEILQKDCKLTYFWAKINELYVLLSVSHPMVTKGFPGVEFCGF